MANNEFIKKDMLATFLSLANKKKTEEVAEYISKKMESSLDELIDEVKIIVNKNVIPSTFTFGFIYAAFISESSPDEFDTISEISYKLCETFGLKAMW